MTNSDNVVSLVPPPAALDEVSLYEIRRKIYPRAVHGVYARWRIALIIATQALFYGLPWLYWNGRQALLFDLGARKFYVFGLVLWPQDVVYLTWLLVIAAFSLFLFTTIAGRLWCGYACPQTVYTEIFMWIERKIEGDRVARIRLDGAPLTLEKFVVKSLKHVSWFVVALWTGYTFVGYFMPIRDLGIRGMTWQLGSWEAFWVVFYAFATYGNAGWMREQVCKYMCPYARFQSVMFDKETLVIAYDAKRGEPRGARGRKIDPRKAGLGDCIDCQICVQVCPTGIDIRKGLQYECIGCAACIDGCDQVMDKMGYPRGLIRYASESSLAGKDTGARWLRPMIRPRTVIYGSLLLAIILAGAVSLAFRNPLKVDVIRDRGALAREATPGVIENSYRLQLMNTDEKPRRFRIDATGLPGLKVVGADASVAVEPATTRPLPLRLQIAADAAPAGKHKIEVVVQDIEDPAVVRREASTFILPRP